MTKRKETPNENSSANAKDATDQQPREPTKRYDERARLGDSRRAARRRNRGNNVIADWREADAALIARAVCAVSRHHFALRFGYTRDGGAYAIGIVGDGDPYTDFIRPGEDIDAYLVALAIDYEALELGEGVPERD